MHSTLGRLPLVLVLSTAVVPSLILMNDCLALERPETASSDSGAEMHWTLKRRVQRVESLPARRVKPAPAHHVVGVSTAAPAPQALAGPVYETPPEPLAPVLKSEWVGRLALEPGMSIPCVVRKGQRLGRIRALSLDWPVVSPAEGEVRALLAEEGAAVEYGQPLLEFVPRA